MYVATEVYMLTDKSEGFQDTWKFLDDRLRDIGFLGKTVGMVNKTVGDATSVLSLLLSVAGARLAPTTVSPLTASSTHSIDTPSNFIKPTIDTPNLENAEPSKEKL